MATIALSFGPFVSATPIPLCGNSACSGRAARWEFPHRTIPNTTLYLCDPCAQLARQDPDVLRDWLIMVAPEDPFVICTPDVAEQLEVDTILQDIYRLQADKGKPPPPPVLLKMTLEHVPLCVVKEARRLVEQQYWAWLKDKATDQYCVEDVCQAYLDLPPARQAEELAELTGDSVASCLARIHENQSQETILAA